MIAPRSGAFYPTGYSMIIAPRAAIDGGTPLRARKEFAREMIHAEELHAADVDKMPRKPGAVAAPHVEAGA